MPRRATGCLLTAISQPLGERRLQEVWIDQRDAIYEEVMSKGWNAENESFVRHYGSEALDASLLLYVRPASAVAFDEKIKAASRKRFGASRRSQIGPRD